MLIMKAIPKEFNTPAQRSTAATKFPNGDKKSQIEYVRNFFKLLET